MIINGLKLENFKSHKNTDIVFGIETTVINGENGAGKSTILEGIQYALFKKNSKNITMHNADSTSVELTFTEKGRQYIVTRSKAKGKTSSKLQEIKDGETVVLASSNKDVDNLIQQIINNDIDLFSNAIYIRQGEITALIDKSPSERKKIITKLLKIDDLEKAWERMPKIINLYENKISEFKGILSTRSDGVIELGEKKDEIESLKKQVTEFEMNLRGLEDEKAQLSKERVELDALRSTHTILSNDIRNAKDNVKTIEIAKSNLSRQYDRIIKMEKDISISEGKLGKFDIDDLNNQISDLNSEIILCKHQNDALKKSLNDIIGVDGKCPVCQSKISDEKRDELIQQYESSISQNNETINSNNSKLKALQMELDEAKNLESKILQLQSSISNKDDVMKALDSTEVELKEKTESLDELARKLQDIDYDDGKYNELSRAEMQLNKTIQHSIESTGVAKGKISKTEHRINVLKAHMEKMDEMEKDMENLRMFVDILNDCREMYGKNGVQHEIRASVKPRIEQNTKEFFEKFNFDYSDLSLTDDYEVSLIGKNGETSISMLSGGEQIAVALALRLGITETIAQSSVECIILDEPTVYLDSVRINELSNLFGNLDIIPQAIIVTHEQSLENVADSLLKVEKNDGISEIYVES